MLAEYRAHPEILDIIKFAKLLQKVQEIILFS